METIFNKAYTRAKLLEHKLSYKKFYLLGEPYNRGPVAERGFDSDEECKKEIERLISSCEELIADIANIRKRLEENAPELSVFNSKLDELEKAL